MRYYYFIKILQINLLLAHIEELKKREYSLQRLEWPTEERKKLNLKELDRSKGIC